MRSRGRGLYAVVCAVVVLTAAWVVLVRHPAKERPVGLAPVGDAPFGSATQLPAGAHRAEYSPDGAHLAVVTGQGVGLARQGRVVPVTRRGSHAVDVAWMPGSNGLLVAEGPGETGQLAVVGLDGAVIGVVRLQPSFGVGAGYGMSVDADGRRAVAVAVTRPPLERERRDLVLVDLASGATRPLTASRAVDAVAPRFLDGDRVAFTAQPVTGHSYVAVLTIGSGAVARLTASDADARVKGVAGGRIVYARAGALWDVAGGGGQSRRLASLPSGTIAVAVDPSATVAVIGEAPSAATDQAVRLRPFALRSPR